MRFSSIAHQALGVAALASAAAVRRDDQDGALLLEDYGKEFDAKTIEELSEEFANMTVIDTPTATSDDDMMSIAAVAPGGPCPSAHIRVEWSNMRNEDRHGFLNGVKCLWDRPSKGGYPGAQNRWEDIVVVHQRMTPQVHENGIFLPWHRYYLWVMMRVMREECGYRGPFPWWDEAKYGGRFAQAPVFTSEYFGTLPGPTNGQGTCITNGAFAGRSLNVGPADTNTRHCLARAVDESQTAQVNQNFVDYCNGMGTYPEMEACSERGPHAFGHNGIGAVMRTVYGSPGDPIFFLHHAFVDRMWRKWQIKDDRRLRNINGCISKDGQPCNPLTLDTRLTSMGLKEDRVVADVLDINNNLICYLYDY